MIKNVKVSAFDIMDNEVTNAQYQQCIGAGVCMPPTEWKYEKGGANQPAIGLNWFEAGEYCEWLGGRLPTEIEWEKAASGPDDKNNYFPWGNTWELARANLRQAGIGSIQSIAQYADSDVSYYGVKNLAGNVREWTASESMQLNEDLASLNTVLKLENNGDYFPVIVRGGAWSSEPSLGMSSIRGTDGTIENRDNRGFRCVCPPGKTCDSPWDWRWIWFGKY
jgi:formylglycine-generating enzyme required for sulfatase activity